MSTVKAARRFSPARIVVFSLVPLLVLLVAGEVTLRGWAYYFRTSYERYNYAHGRLELVPDTYEKAPNGDEFRINSKGFLGPEWTDRKPEGVYRIFALGDSCTFGDGYWRRLYPARLEQLLNSSDSSVRFQVINAGIEGYNSEYALDRITTELPAYEPDMVLIYIGWNDLMKVNPHNAAAVGKHASLARALERSYLVKAYQKLMFFYLRPLIMSPQPGGDVADVQAYDEFVPLAFQANLESMLETLRERRIQPVLVTLATVVDPSMSAEELKRRNVVFPYYAGTYSVARFLSLHRAYNRTIRQAAATYGVPVVEADRAFDSRDKASLFWDTMHPSHEGHAILATSIFDTVQELSLRGAMHAAPVELSRIGTDAPEVGR